MVNEKIIMNMPLDGIWAKIAMIPYELLFPIILMVILVGTYSLNGSLWDVGLMQFLESLVIS
ncbi:MAG: tripartite tricarboxylate transporter permease [Bacillota bacterium]|nr:tripartite tricarboxylate transporter permease [Bacillota bacterium]